MSTYIHISLYECSGTYFSTLNNIYFDFSREVLSFEFLKRVCQHFESSPDLGTALVLHIELLLQRGKELLCKQKIEDIITGTSFLHSSSRISLILINNWHDEFYRNAVNALWMCLCISITFFNTHTGHYTGKQLTPQALTSLHVMLWDKASKHFEVCQTQPCLSLMHKIFYGVYAHV